MVISKTVRIFVYLTESIKKKKKKKQHVPTSLHSKIRCAETTPKSLGLDLLRPGARTRYTLYYTNTTGTVYSLEPIFLVHAQTDRRDALDIVLSRVCANWKVQLFVYGLYRGAS